MGYQAKVYHKQGGDELVVDNAGKITVESGGEIVIKSGGSLTNEGTTYVVTEPDDAYLSINADDQLTVSDEARAMLVHDLRMRVSAADVNAGKVLLQAVEGYKYRLVDCKAIAIGGAAGAVTTVDILGTQSSSTVKLVAFAQANLTQSALLRAGGTGAAILADGASFAACDANAAITIGKTGSDLTTATHIDVILDYVIEKAV